MKFFIDRIEEESAVLIDEDEFSFDFPAKYLPAGAGEGLYIDVTIDIDEEYTQKKRDDIRKLQQKLLNRNKK